MILNVDFRELFEFKKTLTLIDESKNKFSKFQKVE